MNSEVLTELFKLAIPAAVTALVAAAVGGIVKLVGARRKRTGPEPGPGRAIVLPPGVRPPPRPAQPGRLRRGVELVRNLMYGLPPLKWRASLWKATLAGGMLIGFGIAGYFRTRADVLVGIVLSIPFFIAVAVLPEASGEPAAQSSEPSGPYWAYVLAYTTMALTGLYSYLRALSSNRRLEASVPTEIVPKSAAERKKVLALEIQILAAQGWRVESLSDFDAVVSRIKRPNHALHLVLTLLTVWLWGLVWIARTRSSRNKPEREYRRIFVDLWGNWSLEVRKLPSPTS